MTGSVLHNVTHIPNNSNMYQEACAGSLKLIGVWMSEKKFQKLRWTEFANICRSHGYELVKLDLDRPLEEQGPLKVFIHKLTDIIASADSGDRKSQKVISNVEQYISNHPEMTVIDSLQSVRILLDRYRYYTLLEMQPLLKKHSIFTPTFCVLQAGSDPAARLRQACARGVSFPLVCKPLVAHGSLSAHKMAVVFNEAGLAACRTPCVVQSFINHNAVLYKVFMVGNRYYVVERPSLKNFYASEDRETIYFQSGDVCKADSQSTLSILEPHEVENMELKAALDKTKIEAIIEVLRKELKLVLFGVDIVIDNQTNHYAIIDINVYPGYEGFPNFFHHLLGTVDELREGRDDGNIVVNGGGKKMQKYDDVCKQNDEKCLINVSREKINNEYFKNALISSTAVEGCTYGDV